MASRLRGTRKASAPCTRCINRKQTCDRVLPNCSRCASNPASCNYQQPTEPSTWSGQTGNSQPPSTNPFLELGCCGWDLTEHGQAELMQAMLTYDSNDLGARGRMEDRVGEVFHDRGCTVLELLKDPVFETFPLVVHLRKNEYSCHFELADCSWPVLHLAVLLVGTPPCDHMACSQTKRLYVALKAMFAVLQVRLSNHAEIVQIQGLIALYECGHGMLEHAHVTLNSAFTMASLLDVDLSNILISLEWRLSLMLIDNLVALQTVHRKYNWLPLACPPHHIMIRVVKHNFTVLKTPNGAARSDSPSRRTLDFGKIVFETGRILQHVHDSKRDPRVGNPDCELIREFDNYMRPSDEDPNHPDPCQSSRLPISCMFAHLQEMVRSCRPYQRLDGITRTFLHWSCAMARINARFDFGPNSGEDENNKKELSLVNLLCILHSLLIKLRIGMPGHVEEEIAALIPEMRRRRKRWPAAEIYISQICDELQKRQRSED